MLRVFLLACKTGDKRQDAVSIVKLLANLIQPLSLIWLLLGAWLLGRVWQRHWRVLPLPLLAWLILTVIACTPAASMLLARLEAKTPRAALSELPLADAIVCLGGGALPSQVEPTGLHLMPAADRISTALSLLAARKAPLLVLGGGGVEDEEMMVHSEADQLLLALQRLGAPTEAMLSLGVCQHTRDEAEKVSALARARNWRQVLLVTSAGHMPRAAGTFETAGVKVIPVPCNYISGPHRIGGRKWFHLPDADGFGLFAVWVHEVCGTLVYQNRGWLKQELAEDADI